jgi:hypothetical protein
MYVAKKEVVADREMMKEQQRLCGHWYEKAKSKGGGEEAKQRI